MGELIDLITVPRLDSIFYRISSGALRFQVKGPCDASIGLARTPSDKDVLWLVIGRAGMLTTVEKGSREIHSVRTPGILSAHEFREFWIQWHDNIISLGMDYEKEPLMVHREETCDFTYVTFGVRDNNSYSVHWRLELPPLLQQMRIKPISNEIPEWVSAQDQLPDNALIGGFEKENLYIIRASHQGSLTPGKFVPSLGAGYIPWGGAAHEKNEMEVLRGCDCMWLPCSDGRVPAGAVVAGHAESTHETLYVGRARHNEHLIPGKVQISHRVCYIPYDDQEIAMKQYEILVVPLRNIQCANPFFVFDHVRRME